MLAKSADNTGCLIEHFGNADAVPQPPERCLSRQAGIVRYCLEFSGTPNNIAILFFMFSYTTPKGQHCTLALWCFYV